MKKDKNSIGKSGEFFVAAELLRRGLKASVFLGNAETFDILAVNATSNKTYSIQVKTAMDKKKKKWPMRKKNEDIVKKNFYYIFVRLNDKENPDYYVVKSKIVAEEIKNGHQKWLKTKAKNGQKHNDNDMRSYVPNEKYKNAWNVFK